jgi:hypothetical protein
VIPAPNVPGSFASHAVSLNAVGPGEDVLIYVKQ